MDMYELVRGPMAWISLFIFFFGSLSRIVFLLNTGKREYVLNPSERNRSAARSILHGLMPFGSTTSRKMPFLTIISFIFHLCVVILPVFLMAHIVLWYESWTIQWWALPDLLADVMVFWVLMACVYFIFRRLSVPEVKRVTHPADIALPAILLLVFLSGFLASQQWGPYRPMLILHIVSAELLLIMLPISKLGHMMFFGISRAYMGAEFGKHLKTRDW